MSPSTDLTAQYKLEQVLSWTGLGRTFRGQHPETGAPVAVKVLSLARTPGSDMLGQRFLMTARVLSSLNHHTLPEVVNYGMSSTGDAFLVTSWFEGEVLSRLVPIEPRDLLALVVQLTQGLESLALHGLVHLNLSPENILVNGGRPRLTGWGHSLLTVDWQSDPGPPDSQPNAFTAPELCDSRKVGDALWRADLYSLGAITASLLGAELSRDGRGTTVKFQRTLSQQLQQPELLRGVLERCLLIDAEGRLDSYSELARAIQHAMPRGRGADRSVSDTQPLERIRPQDVEQVAKRLEAAGKGVAGATPAAQQSAAEADEPGARRDLFDLRELNPELSDESTPSLDPEMADAIAERLDETGELVAPPHPLEEDPPEEAAAEAPPAAEAETVATRSVTLPAGSSADRGIDRTLIMSNPLPEGGGVQEAQEADSVPAAAAAPATTAKAKAGAARKTARAGKATQRPPTEEIAQSEDPTVIVRSDAVKAIRSGVLPTAAAASAEPAAPKLPPLPIPSSGEVAPPPASPATEQEGAEEPAPPSHEPVAPEEPVSPEPAVSAPPVAATTAPEDGPKIPKAVLVAGAVGAGLFLLVLLVLAIGALRGDRTPEVAAVSEPPPPVELPPAEPVEMVEEDLPVELPQQLLDALELFVQDDLLAARGALDELEEMQADGTLPPEACTAYRALANSVLMARVQSVEAAIRRELRRGRLDPLRRALGTVSSGEAEVLANRQGSTSLLADARTAVEAVEEFERALRSEDPDAMLERAEALRISHPSFEQAQRARERAADWVSESAQTMASNGQLEEALRRLQRLQSLRPDRREVIDQMGNIERQLRSQERFETLAAAIERTSSARRPSEGLNMLQGVAIPASESERFAALRNRLQRELAELDARAPSIRRTTSEDLEFRRDDVLRVPLEISDDYQLVGAELTVRDSEGTVTAMPLEVEGGAAVVELSPSLHGGRDVEFWVTAVDLSGNVGQLGSSQAPIEAKRRRWFRR